MKLASCLALALASLLADCEGRTRVAPPSAPTTARGAASSSAVASAPVPVDPSPTGEDIHRAARAFLARRHFTSRGGRVFCAIEPLGVRERSPGSFDLFVWAYCEELVRVLGVLENGSGSSLPCALTVELQGGAWRVTDVKEPADGAFYTPSLRAIFPADVLERLRSIDKAALARRNREEAERAGL